MALYDDTNKSIEIANDDYVTLTKMNDIYEVQFLEKSNSKMTVRKIDKNNYMVVDTGEIKEYKINENRSQSLSSLRKTFKKLRYLINNNFKGGNNELFITLTYGENMTDTNQLYLDFNKFIKRLKYQYSDLGQIEYLDVIEPQTRGAWHHHVLIKFIEKPVVFLDNKELSDIWGHGFVTVKRLSSVDNIGAYLTSYLSNLEIENNEDINNKDDILEKEVDGVSKRFIKGGRLHLYPSGLNIYRKSRGIKFPDRKVMQYDTAKKIIGMDEPTYESNIFLDLEDYKSHIKFEEYNKNRK